MKKLFAALLSLFVIAGCSSSGGDASKLKIGVNLELSGALADYGSSEFTGVELAIKQANENGGFNGADIEIVKYDNKSDTSEAVSIHTKLTTMDKVSAAISPATSGATAAVFPVTDENGVPTVASSATAVGVTLDGNGKAYANAFRVCFTDAYQAIGMAKFAATNLGAKTAVVFGDSSSDYAKGLRENFVAQFTSMGGKIVAEESYVSGDTDFNAALTKIKAMDYDVIYIPGYYNEAGLIIKQARALGITCPIIGPDGFDSPTLTELAGADALNNVYFTTAYTTVSTDSKVVAFVKAYEAAYGKTPDMFAALSYDAASLIVDAANRAGSAEPSAIRDALEATTTFQGVTGSITFDEEHNPVKSVLVVELVNGEQAKSYEVK